MIMKNVNKKSLVIIVIIMFTIGCFLIKIGLDIEKIISPIYTYTANKNDSYEVSLKENDFYTEKTLPQERYYVSKSIKSFNINFKYDFKANKEANIKYNYNIVASLVGTVNDENEDKEIWTRNFNLNDEVNNKGYMKEFSINENITIDYDKYNSLARLYEKTYNVKIDAVLKVRLNVSYKIDLAKLEGIIDKKIENSELQSSIENETAEDYIELDIPLTNTVTEAKRNYEETTFKNIFDESSNNVKRIILYVLGGLFILSVIVITVIYIIRKMKKTPEEMYEYNIKHILKYYSDLIVTVTNEPNLENLKLMKLEVLDDLIDVAEQNEKHIIHYKIPEVEKSNLYVIVNEYVYIYVVDGNKLK